MLWGLCVCLNIFLNSHGIRNHKPVAKAPILWTICAYVLLFIKNATWEMIDIYRLCKDFKSWFTLCFTKQKLGKTKYMFLFFTFSIFQLHMWLSLRILRSLPFSLAWFLLQSNFYSLLWCCSDIKHLRNLPVLNPSLWTDSETSLAVVTFPFKPALFYSLFKKILI